MKPRVLVVDDELEFLQLLEMNLSMQGFDVIGASNGMEALRQARKELPNAILMDLMLPDLDGYSVCEILHAQPSTRDIPVIILTALDGEVARERGCQANAYHFLTKGVDLREVGERVREACEQYSNHVAVRLNRDEQ